MTFRIVVDDAVVAADSLFSPFGEVIIVPGRDIPNHATRADALIIRSRTRVDDALLAGSSLRFIGSTVVGLDHVDQEACQRHCVHFYSAQGCNARSVAEYVISQIIQYALTRQQPTDKLTLAIIGVGHVGREVATLASVLGMRILLNDPPRAEQESGFLHTPLETCLKLADVVTLHTPLTQDGPHPSHQLMHAQRIGLLKPGSLFINAARGGISDEQALCQRTDLSLITDCWENEPNINQRLLTRSLLATQHIAGHAWDAKLRGGTMARDALARFLNKPAPPLPDLAALGATLSCPARAASPLAQVSAVIQQAYDFRQDDAYLRQCTQQDMAACFENYRRNYPMRREWSSLSVAGNACSPLAANLLQRLGFRLT